MQAAAAMLAATAPSIRSPTLRRAIRNPRCRSLGGVLEVLRLHAVAGTMDVDVAGLQSAYLCLARGDELGAEHVARQRERHLACAECNCGQEVLGKLGGDVDVGDALETLPRRVGVDLEDHELAVGAADQIDARIVGADGCDGGERQALHLVVGIVGDRLGALVHVRDPGLAAPRHGGEQAAVRYEDAPVLEGGRLGSRR